MIHDWPPITTLKRMRVHMYKSRATKAKRRHFDSGLLLSFSNSTHIDQVVLHALQESSTCSSGNSSTFSSNQHNLTGILLHCLEHLSLRSHEEISWSVGDIF